MANICMRSGLKLSIQRGLPILPKLGYYTGGDADLSEKTTNFFTGQPKHASGGLIQLFSAAATASVQGPEKPPINEGDPGHHDNEPVKAATASVKGPEKPPIDKGDPGHHDNEPVKAPKEPRNDTVSDHHEKPEEKKK